MKFTKLLNQWYKVKTRSLKDGGGWDICYSEEYKKEFEEARAIELEAIEQEIDNIIENPQFKSGGSVVPATVEINQVDKETLELARYKFNQTSWKDILANSGANFQGATLNRIISNENELLTTMSFKSSEDIYIQARNFSHLEYDYLDPNGDETCSCCDDGEWMLYDRLFYEIIYSKYNKEWNLSDNEVIERYGKTPKEILKHFKLHDE